MKNVLLVEDDADLTEAIMESLKGADFNVVAASTLTKALQRSSNQKYDLILLDLHLGEDDGTKILTPFELSRAIQIMPYQ